MVAKPLISGVLRSRTTTICPILLCFLFHSGLTALGGGIEATYPERSGVNESDGGERHRSPWMVAISPNRQFIAVPNLTGHSVSLIAAADRRLSDEIVVGRQPRVACWLDEQRLAVSVSGSDELVVLGCESGRLSEIGRYRVGDEPTGVCRIGKNRVAVALRGDDHLVIVDTRTGEVLHRLAVAGFPEHLVVTPDRKWLVSVCALPGEVFVHSLPDLRLVSRRVLMEDGFRPGNPLIDKESKSVSFACLINRHLPVDPQNIERGWTIDNRLASFALPDAPVWQQKQIGLDIRGDAIGDPHWAAISASGEQMIVSCGGSHELVLLKPDRIDWPPSNTLDFLPTTMEDDAEAYSRIPVEGRPLGVEFLDEHTVVVANYLRDSVQWVDLKRRIVTNELFLGAPVRISLARLGETIFYDADRSLHSWFSCHTCHTEGHTSGQIWDTVNDDSYDTFKLTPTLRGVTRTGPWTWHGWQHSLDAAMHKSLKDTLNTTKPITAEDVKALVAFLETLDHPENPHVSPDGRLTARQSGGRSLFEGKANCGQCHRGAELTASEIHDVGLGTWNDSFTGFNPPSLRSLRSRRRFLHDGRSRSLYDVLTRHHTSEKTGGEPLSPEELTLLIEYLKCL